MSCIGQTDARVRSGGAGDAQGAMGRIGKPSRRGNRVCLADPEGRVFKALGRRPLEFGPPLAVRPVAPPWRPRGALGASRRGTILAQGLENAVQPVINTRTGS